MPGDRWAFRECLSPASACLVPAVVLPPILTSAIAAMGVELMFRASGLLITSDDTWILKQ